MAGDGLLSGSIRVQTGAGGDLAGFSTAAAPGTYTGR